MIKHERLQIIKSIGLFLLPLFLIVLIFGASGCGNNSKNDINNENSRTEISEDMPGAVGEDSSVAIIADESDNEKMVNVALENIGRVNPFLPSKEGKALAFKESLQFDLMDPPVTPQADDYTQRVIATKISGIMYDKYNPSAIINIENTDYLVRSGDVINGYKILAINPTTVTVQLGSNIYKAAVGESVDDSNINYNTVSNLSSKFGGAANKNRK